MPAATSRLRRETANTRSDRHPACRHHPRERVGQPVLDPQDATKEDPRGRRLDGFPGGEDRRRECHLQIFEPLRELQERLGAINDVVVAMDAFRAARKTDPRAWFALGWLAGQREVLIRAARPALRAFAKSDGFWKKA